MSKISHYKFAVIGIGDFGRAIARTLSSKGAEVLAIDNDQVIIDKISDDVAAAVVLDATDKKVLTSLDIQSYDAVVVAIGLNFEQRLLVVANLLDLGVKRIIARAAGENQRLIIERMGITEILSPEEEVGTIVAERLINPSIIAYFQLPDDHQIAEIKAPESITGRSLEDLNMRNTYKLSLITIKRDIKSDNGRLSATETHIIGVPDYKTIIQKDDKLVLFGKSKDIARFIEINE